MIRKNYIIWGRNDGVCVFIPYSFSFWCNGLGVGFCMDYGASKDAAWPIEWWAGVDDFAY